MLNNSRHRILQFSENRISLLYIGGTDAATEGTFRSTVTGTPLTYTRWEVNEPNNWGGDQHCIVMSAVVSGSWRDEQCQARFASICEIPRK